VLDILFILLVRTSDVLPRAFWMWPACYDESVSCKVKFMYNIQDFNTAIVLAFVEFTFNKTTMNRSTTAVSLKYCT